MLGISLRRSKLNKSDIFQAFFKKCLVFGMKKEKKYIYIYMGFDKKDS